MNEQPSPTGKKKKLRMEFSPASLFFASLGLVFILGWIFVLGVMVGRGFVPEGVRSLGQMTDQLSRLVAILGSDRDRGADRTAAMNHQTKLEFYDHLPQSTPGPEKGAAGGKIPQAAAVPKPAESRDSEAAGAPEAETTGWVVQVASLDNATKAAELTKKLKTMGYPAYTYKTFVKGSAFHRVRCGPFEARADAEAARRSLAEKENINSFLTTVGQ
jgi:hypothetical protein